MAPRVLRSSGQTNSFPSPSPPTGYLFMSKQLSYADAPTTLSYKPWPKLIPPHLAKDIIRAARDVKTSPNASGMWTETVSSLYNALLESEWKSLLKEQAMDTVATWEYGERGAWTEKDAALHRLEARFQDCLALRVLHDHYSQKYPPHQPPL